MYTIRRKAVYLRRGKDPATSAGFVFIEKLKCREVKLRNKNELLVGVASAAALISTASAASAADALAADDWSGFYIGVSAGSFFGDMPVIGDASSAAVGGSYQLNSASITPGGFAGFNVESNNLVWGAELAVQGSTSSAVKAGKSTSYTINNTIDAKAKLGYDLGQLKPYAFIGASSQSGTGGDSHITYSAYGLNYGAGIDFKATSNVIIGVEFIGRSMVGHNGIIGGDASTQNQEISLRASYLFN